MFFYSQRSPKFTVRGIQTMIEAYSQPWRKNPKKKLNTYGTASVVFVKECT